MLHPAKPDSANQPATARALRLCHCPTNQLPVSTSFPRPTGVCYFLAGLAVALLCANCAGQTSPLFEVSNSKHIQWSAEEAGRIYSSASELVARTIRPERPPYLHPRFVLVLGTQENETIRKGDVSEIHLKSWKPENFAEAVVLMAIREVIKSDKVADLVRSTVVSAGTSVSVNDLRRGL